MNNHSHPDPAPWRGRPACCQDRTPALTVDELTVTYDGVPALRGLTLPVNHGCLTAIVGPSGCGKSTFLSCLNRMTDLVPGCTVHGRIRLGALDVLDARVDLVGLRRKVGMIFQRPNPFPLSIRDNLTLPLTHHRLAHGAALDDTVEHALRQVGLWDEVAHRLSAPALSLSGGQQQRLCLARALVLEPDVLLLDEPCSALDPMAAGVVEDLITSLRGRYTLVMVTHNLAQARRVADDVAVLWMHGGAGTLVEHGTAGQVFETPAHEITAAYLAGVRG
ncbi:MAG: phosphate ABC transporter ATP-binding protein [Vicinamibacterales bacterium]|nr:phosphate ABC transporter ATP-binding protein [Vicinamibacterales bacterium]